MMKTGIGRLAAAVLLVGVVAGSTTGEPALETVAHADPLVLRVGYFPNITHAQAVLGFGEGIFSRQLSGVVVQGTVFNAGPDEMNALFAGALDMAYVGPGPAITGYVKSHGAVVIVAGASSGGALLVSRGKAGISSVKGLDGKTVAVPQLGNTQDIELRALLKDAGLSPTSNGGTVRIIAVNNADTLTLFKKGELDAALVPEPWGTRLVKQTGAHIVRDWHQLYGGTVPAAVVIASSAFVKAHRDLVIRFLRVHAQLTRDLSDRAAVYAPLYNQLKKLSGKGIPSGILLTSLSKTQFSTAIDQSALAQFATFSQTAGYLKKNVDLSGLVDSDPLAHLSDASIQ